MKKIILLLFLQCLAFNLVNAQIIIEASDYAEINVDYQMSVGVLDSENPITITEDTNGPWDFSFLTESASDVVTFIDPSETDFATVFPNANMVMDYQSMGQGFIDKNIAQVKLEGLVLSSDFIPMGLGGLLGDGLSFNLDSLEGDDIVLMEFPMEMGSEMSNSKSISDEGIASELLEEYGIDPSFVPEEYQASLDFLYIIITIELSVESEVDGYGTLSIPNAEFETLRQKNTTGLGFSIATPIFSQNIVLYDTAITSSSYSWYAKEEGVPVLAANVNGEGVVTQFLYKTFEDTKVDQVSFIDNDIKLYPNPAQDYFEVYSASNNAKRICLYDVMGKKIKDLELKTNQRVDVSDLSNGIYYTKVSDAEGKILNSSKITIH